MSRRRSKVGAEKTAGSFKTDNATDKKNFFFSVDNTRVLENEREKRKMEKEEPKKLKPCCACPETRKVRDACIAEKGAESCPAEIEAHKECMKKMGFNV